MPACGINRIFAALPEDQLRHLQDFQPENESEGNVQDVVSDPVTGDIAQISLARFTNLDRLTVCLSGIEYSERLQAALHSWKPTEASSRYLEVRAWWGIMQSVLSPGEDTGSIDENISALEEICGSMFFRSTLSVVHR